jgi:hypothetical protein
VTKNIFLILCWHGQKNYKNIWSVLMHSCLPTLVHAYVCKFVD